MLWVDVAPFEKGGIFRFQPLVFGGWTRGGPSRETNSKFADENKPFEKDMFIFQPLIFRCKLLVSVSGRVSGKRIIAHQSCSNAMSHIYPSSLLPFLATQCHTCIHHHYIITSCVFETTNQSATNPSNQRIESTKQPSNPPNNPSICLWLEMIGPPKTNLPMRCIRICI